MGSFGSSNKLSVKLPFNLDNTTRSSTMANDGFEKITDVPVEFIKEGTAFIKRCTKPDWKEYVKITRAVGAGFLVMGAIGYFVKLIHIPIRHLIAV